MSIAKHKNNEHSLRAFSVEYSYFGDSAFCSLSLFTILRFWSAPASWTQHQAAAVRSKVGPFARWNFNFERIGLTVRNKAVTLQMHDTKSKSHVEQKPQLTHPPLSFFKETTWNSRPSPGRTWPSYTARPNLSKGPATTTAAWPGERSSTTSPTRQSTQPKGLGGTGST